MDISHQFDETTLNILAQAALNVKNVNHSMVSVVHVLDVLYQSSDIVSLIDSIGYNTTEDISQIRQTLQTFSTSKNKKIYFSIDLQRSLFLAYLICQEYQRIEVTKCDLLLALLNSETAAEHTLTGPLAFPGLEVELQHKCGGVLQSKSEDEAKVEEHILLSKYSKNINQLDRESPVSLVERTGLVNEIVNNLSRRSQQSVLLVGEIGVGRMSLILLLIRRIAAGHIPLQLNDTIVRELDVPLLLNSFHADQRVDFIVEQLLNEIHSAGKSIIVLRDIGQMLENDKDLLRYRFIEQFLQKLIESNVPIIATSQHEKYITALAKNPLISSTFSVLNIPPATEEEANSMLNTRKTEFEQFYSITISNEVFESLIDLALRYMKEIILPGSAFTLLDQICSQIRNTGGQSLTVDDIRLFISQKTGIPITRMSQFEKEKFSRLEQDLNLVVKGQQAGVHAVSNVVVRSRAGLKDPKKPIGSFLFLGPSGVGKTFLAKNLATQVYDDEAAMVRIDMSEFGESHTTQRLIGAPPGYVGYEEGGQLTNPVYEKPYSLILLDEIEKAHLKVFDIFLQVLDEGHLTDGKGRRVDFKNTIIIMTSNIASKEIVDFFADGTAKEVDMLENFKKGVIMPELTKHFRLEFINRFDDTVIFNPLSKDMLKEIGLQEIKSIQDKVSAQGIKLEVKESTLTDFVDKSYNPALGARPLIRMLRENIEDNLAQRIVADTISFNEKVTF